MRKNIFYGIIILSSLLLSNCDKDDEFEFGNTQSDFITDSIYKTKTDGLLFVQLKSDGLGEFSAIIYADIEDNPTDTLAIIDYFGSITLPIKKDLYWCVKTIHQDRKDEKLIIQWTPMN